MTPSDALIICDDLAYRDRIVQTLAGVGLIGHAIAPQQLLEQRSLPPVGLICVCRCDETAAQTLLLKIHIELADSLAPIIVVDAVGEPSRAAVQVLPAAQTSADQLRQELAKLFPLTDRARQAGVRCDVRFRMISNSKCVDTLNDYLQKLYRRFGIDIESDHRLTTAVREMSHNAIEWGNRGITDAIVLLRCTIDASSVTIHIRDSGPGFNRDQLPHAASPQDPTRHLHVRDELGLRAGGFGILMTRGLVDELSYNDAGNEVKIVKRFSK